MLIMPLNLPLKLNTVLPIQQQCIQKILTIFTEWQLLLIHRFLLKTGPPAPAWGMAEKGAPQCQLPVQPARVLQMLLPLPEKEDVFLLTVLE
jgi:hypothetical protein